MMNARSGLAVAGAIFLGCAVAGTAQAASQGAPKDAKLTGQLGAIKSYCANIRDLAKDARHLRQLNELSKLSAMIDAKVKELRKRTAEYQKWYELRRKFSEKATDSLVKIYSKMRPDSAAAQISEMNKMTAAALIIKLDTRKASAVLNEIEPKKAAVLSGIIAAAARKAVPEDRS
ncbi:MAG: MotE family protein [Hyphomicrobiaceae bacterium]